MNILEVYIGFGINSKIFAALTKSKFFDSSEFEVTGNRDSVVIKYSLSDYMYSFNFILPSKQEPIKGFNNFTGRETTELKYVFKGSMYPGLYSENESFEVHTFDSLLAKITEWCGFLPNDLCSIPEQKRFNEIESTLEEFNQKFNEKTKDIEDNYMTKEEADFIISKLNEMEKNFNDQLTSEIDDKEKLKQELQQLKLDFDSLKESTSFLKKKSWVKKCTSKLLVWYSNADKKSF